MGPFQYRILVAAGLCFASDSMEVLLLSFLAVVLQAQWDLPAEASATITSSVFLGATLGTLVLGPLGDTMGRKPVFTLTAGIIAVFGFATAAANDISALIILRFLVGFGVGGLTVPFDTLAEFVPTSSRGTSLMLIEYFWTLGTLITPVFAYVTLGEGGAGVSTDAWRWFVILCAVPCLASTIVGIVYVPESPRWLLAKGKYDEALAVMRQAAKRSGKHPHALFPPGTRLVEQEAEAEHGTNVGHLFSPEWRRKTILLWMAWAGFAFVYYGNIMIVTLVFTDEETNAGSTFSHEDTNSYSFDYGAIMTSASAELAGTTLVIFLIDRIGRVPTQVSSYIGGGCMVYLLCMLKARSLSNDAPSHRTLMVLASFLARMAFMSASCSTWIATAEILTTDIRATGHAASNAVARLGGSLSPYLVTDGTPISTIGSVMLTISLVTAFAVAGLPETMGLSMGTSSSSSSSSSDDDGDLEAKPQKLIKSPPVPT